MSDTVYVLDQVGIRLVKEKTLISDTQLKRPEQVVGFVSDILREYDREVMWSYSGMPRSSPAFDITSVTCISSSEGCDEPPGWL